MPQQFWRHSVALLFLLSGLLGCRDATAPAACDEPLNVLVSPGVTPSITWSPRCGISQLIVMSESRFGEPVAMVWGFTVSELTPLGPGVRYGQAPRGATEMMPAQPLRAGASYRVWVSFVVGGDVISADGERIFVP
jgi:hypothetical protein